MSLLYSYCLTLSLGLALASGQMNTGEISGSVLDPSGSALPGATIVALPGSFCRVYKKGTQPASNVLRNAKASAPA